MVLIFLTGAIVLALEVLASRIMTPYFGVSLYIWAGILSITLTFLALGYYLGGQITRRGVRETQTGVFLLLPISSAITILIAAVIYPYWFPELARLDLILGSFVASALLLAFPLICLSAMNPILIALRADASRPGDGGAGQVFFVSTVGSVAGVLVTAFVIIPNLTNYSALLWLGLALCAATAIASSRAAALSSQRRLRLVSCAAIIGILCSAFIATQEQVLKFLTVSESDDAQVDIVAEYTSVFGNIKVVDLSSKSNRYPTVRAFVQDGIIQNRITGKNLSVSMYTYVLERLAQAFSPKAESALLLGLGAGIVPREMKDRGLEVTVVEINPDALKAAAHFGFDFEAFEVRVQDARTFVRDCRRRFDVVVVDLFQGDGTPDYLLTREFFADLRRCLDSNGIVVMNVFFHPVDETPNRRLLRTIATSFAQVFEFHVPGINAFVVGTASSTPKDITFSLSGVPPPLLDVVGKSLSSGRLVTSAMLRGYEPMTDQQNLFSILLATARMMARKDLVTNLPPRVLVN